MNKKAIKNSNIKKNIINYLAKKRLKIQLNNLFLKDQAQKIK